MCALECSLAVTVSIDEDLAEEIAKQSAWISPNVHDVRVSPGGGGVLYRIDLQAADVNAERDRV
jgi:hypothetical protein